MTEDQHDPKHVEITPSSSEPPSPNPLSNAFSVTVSIPEAIDIVMVDASAQTDFEVWLYISSVLSNAVVGYLVAHTQTDQADPKAHIYIVNAAIYGVLFIASIGMAVLKRSRIKRKSKKIKMQVAQ